MLYGSLDGRGVWGRVDTSICMAESLCCPPVTITLLIVCGWMDGMRVQSCLTLWDPMDGTPPDSPVCGVFQTRVLEWVAVSFSRRSYHQKIPAITDLQLFSEKVIN